jgi:putative polyhydroxyalkanoate system protein
MPNLTISIPHQLSRAEAKRRIQEQVAQLRQQHGSMLGRVDERWEGDTLHFSVSPLGQTISGQAFVEDQAVRLEIALPWMLSMLAGSVKQTIEQRGHVLLEHKLERKA